MDQTQKPNYRQNYNCFNGHIYVTAKTPEEAKEKVITYMKKVFNPELLVQVRIGAISPENNDFRVQYDVTCYYPTKVVG